MSYKISLPFFLVYCVSWPLCLIGATIAAFACSNNTEQKKTPLLPCECHKGNLKICCPTSHPPYARKHRLDHNTEQNSIQLSGRIQRTSCLGESASPWTSYLQVVPPTAENNVQELQMLHYTHDTCYAS